MCDEACGAGQMCCNGSCIDVPNLMSAGNFAMGQNNCEAIENLTVTLTVTQDMIAEVNGGPLTSPVPNGGFSLQLNAWPKSGQPAWFMQYAISIQNNQAFGLVEYWTGASTAINAFTPTFALPPNTIHAGSVVQIELSNDGLGNVDGATFSITDPTNGITTGPVTVAPPILNGQPVLLPIYGFFAAIVGPDDSETSAFSSGKGAINYTISNGSLCLQGDTSICQNVTATGTNENSTISYGVIDPCCGTTLAQTFAAP